MGDRKFSKISDLELMTLSAALIEYGDKSFMTPNLIEQIEDELKTRDDERAKYEKAMMDKIMRYASS